MGSRMTLTSCANACDRMFILDPAKIVIYLYGPSFSFLRIIRGE